MRPGFAILLATSTVLAPAAAQAQRDASPGDTATPASRAGDAEALIAKGVALRQEGKDAEALAFFRRAHEAHPSARARAQIGLGEQALGMWLAAEADLLAALADAQDPWVKRYREPLETSLATVRGRLGSLEIVVNVPNAEVIVDGAKLGAGPSQGPFRVVAGARTVVVQAPLHHPVSRSIVVPGGGVARETFELVPAPASVPVGAPGAGDGSRTGEGERSDRSSNDGAQRRLGWVLLGGSGVVLLGGVATQVVRELNVLKYNESTCPGLAVPTSAQPADCQSRISTAQTWQTVAIIGYATGAALAAAGAILLLTAPNAPRATAERKLPAVCSAAPSSGGASIWCEARF